MAALGVPSARIVPGAINVPLTSPGQDSGDGLDGTGSSMARRPRGLAGGEIYHVVNCGALRAPLFADAVDARLFHGAMRDALARHPVDLLAWCVMPNHWHLLVRPRSAGGAAAVHALADARAQPPLAGEPCPAWARDALPGPLPLGPGRRRRASADRAPLHRAQPGSGGSGRQCHRLAVVEPASPAERQAGQRWRHRRLRCRPAGSITSTRRRRPARWRRCDGP